MATLPTAVQISADILSRTERADDIERLKTVMDLPELDYVDVSAQMELLQAFERWPLLGHVEEHYQAPLLDLNPPAEDTP